MSIISFVLTIIVRFSVDKKRDLSDGLSSRYRMVVIDNIKPFVIAIPALISLIIMICVIKSDSMDKKDKCVSLLVALFSLVASIGIINLKLVLK